MSFASKSKQQSRRAFWSLVLALLSFPCLFFFGSIAAKGFEGLISVQNYPFKTPYEWSLLAQGVCLTLGSAVLAATQWISFEKSKKAFFELNPMFRK